MVRWSNDDDLWLFTIEEFNQIPDGVEFESIMGDKAIKGKDYIDLDTRYGHIAYGVRSPRMHEQGELFTKFRLENGL